MMTTTDDGSEPSPEYVDQDRKNLSVNHDEARELAQIKHSESNLARCYLDIEKRKDAAYEERNRLVALLARMFPSGLAKTAIEGWSEDWHNCVYINTPAGQLSWHIHDSQMYLFEGLPPYTGQWDGHTTEEKYDRIEKLVGDIAQGVFSPLSVVFTTVYGKNMYCPQHGTCPVPDTCAFKRTCDPMMINHKVTTTVFLNPRGPVK
jgi:hypothetical protein